MNSRFWGFIPVGLVIFSFWLIAKRKREKNANLRRKDDVWYVVKEYLKLTGRQGYKIFDLTLYPRPTSMSSLREYINSTRKELINENNRLLGLKPKKENLRKRLEKVFWKKEKLFFPREEEYQKKIELETLKVLSEKYSFFQSYLQEYFYWINIPGFHNFLKEKTIGEALSEVTKNKKFKNRRRYLVCFRAVDKKGHPSPWESMEIELFLRPEKKKREPYKIFFTAPIEFRKELHWIHSMQVRHYKDKVEARIQQEKNQIKEERKQRIGKIFSNIFLLNYWVPKMQQLFLNMKDK